MFEVLSVAMPPFQGVAAGQTATAQLPIGRRYNELHLTYAGVTLAQMTEIRIIANGETIHRYSAVERDTINVFEGRGAAAGILVLPFQRYDLLQRLSMELTALNTGVADAAGVKIATLSIEIDIDGAAAAPALSLSAEQAPSVAPTDQAGALRRHQILRTRKYTRSPAGAGVYEIADIPGGVQGANPRDLFLNKMAIFSSAVTAVKVERDNFTVFDRTAARNSLVQSNGVRVPQSNLFVIDRTEEGRADMLQLATFQDVRYKVTVSGATTLSLLGEFWGNLEG